ncbi:hypothetical protein [Vampirovibrio sp.]|uniref:hypothetical protein n=1 Tax=Vampirovibrio sp. TaxID=2717857 RepID=UPI0035940232
MIHRLQHNSLSVYPRPLPSKASKGIAFGHTGGHVHSEKCGSHCNQPASPKPQTEQRQFCLVAAFQKVKAFFEKVWNWLAERFRGAKKTTPAQTEAPHHHPAPTPASTPAPEATTHNAHSHQHHHEPGQACGGSCGAKSHPHAHEHSPHGSGHQH